MKSKKLLSIIMSLSMAFGIALPSLNVQAMPIVPTTKYEVKAAKYFVPPDIEKIVEMLKREGKIPDNATPEETQKIVSEYLKKADPARNKKPTEREYDRISKMLKKSKIEGLKEDKEYKVSKSLKIMSDPEYVQPEGDWKGDKKTVRPLIVLMEFDDYMHDEFNDKEIPYGADFIFDDYGQAHYQNMLFGDNTYKGPKDDDGNQKDFYTMKKWYDEQSGGSFVVDGKATKWYKAKKPVKYYGEDVDGSHDINSEELVMEALDNVVKDDSIDLSEFDSNGDGVIDYFIVVHASADQAAGGGSLGDDAIWSHKTNFLKPYAGTDNKGREWKVDVYNVDPQDGAPGVFCHEFGHAIGLPDEYDTMYSGLGSPVGYWSIMAGGSWTGVIGGTEPSGFSPWCKQFLQANYGGNWLKGETVDIEDITEEGRDFLIDEASTKGTNLDVVRIDLPEKVVEIVKPVSGEYAYFSGSGAWLDNSMTASVNLPNAQSAELTFKASYSIEEGWDFATVEVKEENSDDWKAIEGNITTTEHDAGAIVIVDHGITGESDGWVDAVFDLTAYAGQNIDLRLRYLTDPAANLPGLYVDDINITADGQMVLSDNAEIESEFTFDGFSKSDGIKRGDQYYLVEWRNHAGTDSGLKDVRGIGLSYDPGMVVWYVDETYDDNWTGDHPGEGFVGVVDADQKPIYWDYHGSTYAFTDTSRLIHDAAFGLRRTSVMDDIITWVWNEYRGTSSDSDTFMHPYFDDIRDYSQSALDLQDGGRIVPPMGLKIYVTGESKDRSVAKIHVVREKVENDD